MRKKKKMKVRKKKKKQSNRNDCSAKSTDLIFKARDTAMVEPPLPPATLRRSPLARLQPLRIRTPLFHISNLICYGRATSDLSFLLRLLKLRQIVVALLN